jgi:hypothetical protein
MPCQCICYAVLSSIQETEILHIRGSVTHRCLVRWRSAMTHNRLIWIRTSQLSYVHVSLAQHGDKSQHRGNKSFWSVSWFKYLGTTQTNQKCIYAKINNKLNPRNPRWHLVQYLSGHCRHQMVWYSISWKPFICPIYWWLHFKDDEKE